MVISDLEVKANSIRELILEMAVLCGDSVHIGGSLSMVEILTVLYGSEMNCSPANVFSQSRDRFVLSKGHGFLGLLATLRYFGYVSRQDASLFMQDGSDFSTHPVKNEKFGIEASTGSLGQGIGYAAGIACSFKNKGLDTKVYTLIGDGECNEGSVWEAAALATHLRLSNFTVFVDKNGFQNDGACEEVLGRHSIGEMFEAIGFDVYCVDGHSVGEIVGALSKRQASPLCLICETVKGRGIKEFESNNDWHHNRLTPKEHDRLTAGKVISDH